MNGFTPRGVWRAIRRARLLRVLAVYVTTAFVVLQAVDIFVERLALPDWFFPGALVLLMIGLPIIVATALVQSAPAPSGDEPGLARGAGAAEPLTHAGTAEPLTRAATGDPPAHTGTAEAPPGPPAATRDDASATPSPSPSASPSPSPVSITDVARVAREWLTWHRAIAGGLLAFLLLIAAVSGYTAMRAFGIGPLGSLVAAGVIDQRERILIADFQSQTGDTLLAAVVTEAFRVDFAQSPVVTVVEPAFVRDVLRRMERDPGARLDDELAREVALRDGIKAVVTGDIAAAGTGYVVSARLVATETHQVLAAFRETAADGSAIIPAIDRLSKRLRKRIGESLRTIRANPPLEQVTTSSLEALVKYSQALQIMRSDGDDRQAIALLDEAIALDPDFAMAYRALGVHLGNRFLYPARRIEAATRAYELRDRLTERERYLTTAQYHASVTGDRDEAILAYRALLATGPEDYVALNNLGVLYWQKREWERAYEHYRRAWEADSTTDHLPLTNQVPVLYNLGRVDEARAVLEGVNRRSPGLPTYYSFLAGLEAAEGNYESAAALLRELGESRPDDPNWHANIAYRLGTFAQVHGKLAEAARHVQAARAFEERRGTGPQGRLRAALDEAASDLVFRDARDRAVATLEAALARDPLDEIDPRERPYVAWLFAEAGRPDRVRAMIADFDAAGGAEAHRSTRVERRNLDAALALAERRFADLLEILPETDDGPCSVCGLPRLARTQLELGMTDAARETYERYLSTKYIWRTWEDAWSLAEAYETLAELYEEAGDLERARMYHSLLIELWRDADPELQPRVRAAEQRLARLVGETPGR